MTATSVKWLEIFMWVMNFSRDQYIDGWYFTHSVCPGWQIVWRKKLHSSSTGVMVRNRQFNQSNPSSQIDVVLMLYLLLLQCVLWLAGCCDLIKYRVDLVVGTWIQFIFPFSFFKIRCYHWIDLLDEISWAVSVPSCYYTGIKWCFPGEYVMHSTRY